MSVFYLFPKTTFFMMVFTVCVFPFFPLFFLVKQPKTSYPPISYAFICGGFAVILGIFSGVFLILTETGIRGYDSYNPLLSYNFYKR